MQAVGRIGRLDFVVNGFINPRRTERDAGAAIHGRAFRPANIGVLNRQMGGFFFAMLGGRHCREGVFVKILVRLQTVSSGGHRLVVLFDLKLRQQPPQHGQRHSAQRTELGNGLSEIPGLFHLFIHVGLSDQISVFCGGHLGIVQRLPDRLGRLHSRVDGVVQTLDLMHIDKTGAVPQDHHVALADAPRLGVSRYGVVSTLGNHFGAGLDDLAPVDELFDQAVILEIRQRILHIEIAVLPVGPHNHADGQMILGSGVHDAAAEHPGPDDRRPDGIAHRVNDPPRRELVVLFGADLDQLFDADRIQLRTLPFQVGLFDKRLG